MNKFSRSLSIFLFDKKLPLGINKPVKHILVINWHGRIGDAIVSSFFFREIRKIENIIISVITNESLKSLYIDFYNVDNIYTVSNKLSYYELFKVSKELKDVDTIIPLMGLLNMKNLFFISRINPKNLFSLDDKLGYSNMKMGKKTEKLLMHEIMHFILEKLDIQDIDDRFIIPLMNKNFTHYDILFNPFASRLDKSFSRGKSISILELILNRYKNKTIGILSSPDTKLLALELEKAINSKNVSVVNKIDTFYDAIDIIRNSNMIISIDTSLVHIASGLDKKLIAVYYKQGKIFNTWLPKKSINTKIIFSVGTEIYEKKNMNNFNNEDIIRAIDSFGEF
ncbi:MAG TPA: lipopolysaccharide heptosyltransferase family protein [Arcobacter sp.]|nr:lipopolysaccharide heptosyltransferase family protein [Arcobacter sp.]